MFSPIVLALSIFIASIVGVHITLSYNVQRMIKLAIKTLVCIYTSMTFPTFFEIRPFQEKWMRSKVVYLNQLSSNLYSLGDIVFVSPEKLVTLSCYKKVTS